MTYIDRWRYWYQELDQPKPYGDTQSYDLAAAWLSDVELIEDWGCGMGWMRTLIEPGRYRGVDGTRTRYTDVVADLREYRSAVPAVHMRHVLEHNHDWRVILENAVASFQKKMVLTLFTPMAEQTIQIGFTKEVDAPDLSFSQVDIESCFAEDCLWRIQRIKSDTQYGEETLFFIER